MGKNIWLLRWVFDPVHEGHYANIVASISAMQLKEFNLTSQSLEIAQRIWIILDPIIPNLSTSSSFIRLELIKNRDKKPIWLNDSVYHFILENDFRMNSFF
jgi:hypothetical protein